MNKLWYKKITKNMKLHKTANKKKLLGTLITKRNTIAKILQKLDFFPKVYYIMSECWNEVRGKFWLIEGNFNQ